MNDQQIQEIADKVIAALENLAPADPGFQIANLGPVAVFIAAGVAAVVGWRNLLHQQTALKESNQKADDALSQKREADARSEWWRRTQWALEATVVEDERMNSYGVGMLQILIKSDMAGPGDKEMLDAVWRDSDVGTDEDIDQLIEELQDLDEEDLDPEEAEVLGSYVQSQERQESGGTLTDDPQEASYVLTKIEEVSSPAVPWPTKVFSWLTGSGSRPNAGVDDTGKSRDNEAKKEGGTDG